MTYAAAAFFAAGLAALALAWRQWRRIRRHPRGEEIRLVAVTGWGQESDKRRALQAGFDHHLTKPVAVEELEQVLHVERAEAAPGIAP